MESMLILLVMRSEDGDMVENLFLDVDHLLLLVAVVMPVMMMTVKEIFKTYLMDHFPYV
jgi:hypothetical protein